MSRGGAGLVQGGSIVLGFFSSLVHGFTASFTEFLHDGVHGGFIKCYVGVGGGVVGRRLVVDNLLVLKGPVVTGTRRAGAAATGVFLLVTSER